MGAVPEQETQEWENEIWELKKQSYILQKVVSDGNNSSAFI